MPVPNSPPFVSTAIIQPRQLNRWLDINPQGGPLGRTQTFITLPAFNVAYVWKGYSEIVAAFNFEGPNNFSLTGLQSELPVSPNYLLCIMWSDSHLNVYRYSLWRGVGEVIYFNITPYTGQKIGKNFRFEVWSTATGNSSINSANINFYTSVLGIYDYRFGNDAALVGNDGIVTNFQCITNIPASPIISATDQFKPSGIVQFGGAYVEWIPSNGTGSVAEITSVPTINTIQGITCLGLHTAVIQINLSSPNTVWHNLYLILDQINNGGTIILTNSSAGQLFVISVGLIGGAMKVSTTLGSQTITVPIGDIIGIQCSVVGTQVTITCYNKLGVILGTFTQTYSTSTLDYIQVGVVDNFFEIIQSVAPIDFINYIHANYGNGYPLPLTFPAGSVPQHN